MTHHFQLSRGFTPEIQNWIFASEGGYVDHPKDPGGATNMGITFKVLQAWLGRKITKQDVKNLSRSTAVDIYTAQYWNAVKASQLPLGLDYAVFDYAVNSGPSRAIKDLQRIVGSDPDGVMGIITLQKVENYAKAYGVTNLLLNYINARWEFVHGLSTFSTFGNGWRKRIWGNKDGAQTNDIGVIDRATLLMTGASNIPVPSKPTEPVGHAYPEKPSVTDAIKDPGVLTAVGGIITSLIGAVADQPVLQLALVAAGAFLIYRFVIVKQREEVS